VLLINKKVKTSHTCYRVLGTVDDPGVQAVSPQVTWSHPPGGKLSLLSTSLGRYQVILLGDRGT